MSLWNHPLCDDCWKLRAPEREPVRIRDVSKATTCAQCGRDTYSGIWVRIQPGTLPYSPTDDDDS